MANDAGGGTTNDASALCPAGVDTTADPSSCGACGHECAPALIAEDYYIIQRILAVDATSVYFATYNELVKKVPRRGGTTIRKVPIGGGTPTTLVSGQQQAEGITVEHDSIYWVTRDSKRVMRFDKNACQHGTCVNPTDSPDHPRDAGPD